MGVPARPGEAAGSDRVAARSGADASVPAGEQIPKRAAASATRAFPTHRLRVTDPARFKAGLTFRRDPSLESGTAPTPLQSAMPEPDFSHECRSTPDPRGPRDRGLTRFSSQP